MRKHAMLLCCLGLVSGLGILAATALVEGQTPKRGGILNSVLI
jgi:hypothetical protein